MRISIPEGLYVGRKKDILLNRTTPNGFITSVQPNIVC